MENTVLGGGGDDAMREEALFLNGVYEDVLREILLIQKELPEQILFLQPYSSNTITRLRDDPPSVESPMRLLIQGDVDQNYQNSH